MRNAECGINERLWRGLLMVCLLHDTKSKKLVAKRLRNSAFSCCEWLMNFFVVLSKISEERDYCANVDAGRIFRSNSLNMSNIRLV